MTTFLGAASPFETLVNLCQSTSHHNP